LAIESEERDKADGRVVAIDRDRPRASGGRVHCALDPAGGGIERE
jgi:hypothetical protein